MIDLNKFHKISVIVDPYTYLAINNIAELKGITIKEAASDIIVNNPEVYNVAEALFRVWVEIEKDLCTKDDE